MNKAMKKNYVKPQSVCLCAEPEQMLLAGSGDSAAKASVQEWNEDETTDLGSTTMSVSEGLW